MARFHDPAYGAAVRAAVAEHRPTYAVVNHLHLAIYADALGSTPWVLREHNVEYSWMERYAATRRNPLIRLYARAQSHRLRRFERKSVERAALVLAIQEDEARLLRALAPAARIEAVPVGVEFSRFTAPAPTSPPIVLMIGSFAYAPNAEGARRFIAGGWDELRRRVPGVRLRLVGRGIPGGLAAAWAARGVEVVGTVADVAPEFAGASVVLVPVWFGAGARVKIVEAAAARVPVVATSLGAEGLDFEAGEEITLAEDPMGLAQAAAGLLRDAARALEQAARAHARAEGTFSLARVAERTQFLCRSIQRGLDA
jgi:glycosyltransferase involved in cell wall biosynthesis